MERDRNERKSNSATPPQPSSSRTTSVFSRLTSLWSSDSKSDNDSKDASTDATSDAQPSRRTPLLSRGVVISSISSTGVRQTILIQMKNLNFVWGPPDSARLMSIPVHRIQEVSRGFPARFGALGPRQTARANRVFYIALRDNNSIACFIVDTESVRDLIVSELEWVLENMRF
jgi:hypothetical protein